MSVRRAFTHAASVIGAVAALSWSAWAATGRAPDPQAQAFTLAPIMATRTHTGNGRPQRQTVRVALAVTPPGPR